MYAIAYQIRNVSINSNDESIDILFENITKRIYSLCLLCLFITVLGMVVSVLFILATIVVYILLPELHNLHGSCLVCHLAGLVIAYTLTAWVKFNGWDYVDSGVCSLRGHLMYFTLLSAFLWSNVISYDLWRNFR